MAEATLHQGKFHDITHFGLRLVIGSVFILHGYGKFNPGFSGFLGQQGIPAEMQIPIALAEFVPGVLVIVGGLTRISASLLSIMMLGAIFHVKKASSLTGQGGVELEVMLLAGALVLIVLGPGRISISHVAKKIPRFLQ
ncbi:MAG TPA: DoxX family protein [Candidatus Nitrosotenuis sp.]|nr:DoxX family protein [Candidatus Nitrosotenuis sp.]